MRKWVIIIGLAIVGSCFVIAFPVWRGRINSAKIIEAVEQNNVALVKSLLNKGINVNTKNKDGAPLLLISVAKGHKEITKLLLDEGANVNIKHDVTTSYIKHFLFKRPASVTFGGMTALQVAAVKGDKEITQLLLDSDADADIHQDIFAITTVGYRDEQPVSMTIGGTALHMALVLGNREIIELLLPKTTNVNTRGFGGWTPLDYAIAHGYADVVKTLLEKGADVNAKDNDFGLTPLHKAVMTPYSAESENDCADPEIAEQLIIFGADVDAKDKLGITPLRTACLNQCPELVELLLERGANVNMTPKGGSTLLHFAALVGNKDLVEILLDHGADINALSNKGRTALDLTVKEGYTDLAELLRERGAKTGDALGTTSQ